MNFYNDVFLPLCVSRGVSPTKAATEAGLSKTMVTNWKSRGSNPTTASMYKLAQYFDMTIQEMLSGGYEQHETESQKEEQPPAKSEELSAMQAALIEYCRNLSEPEAAAALQALIALHTARQYPGAHE